MKTNQKQTIREATLGMARFPKFAIPPEMLILQELALLEAPEDLGPLPRLNYIVRQRRRD